MLKTICLLFTSVIQLKIGFSTDCRSSITTASGSYAPKTICSEKLIFEENFNSPLDKKKWIPEVTLWGGGNNEFQWYVGDNENSFTEDGYLHIKPTLTVDKPGYKDIINNDVDVPNCTASDEKYCKFKAGGDAILNPVRSARLTTNTSFSFKYGRVEIVAKIPEGDWLWPAAWLLPSKWKYGGWPLSGEIDVIESRGNKNYANGTDQMGVERVSSTLHFGFPNNDPYRTFVRYNPNGYQTSFHSYEFLWDEYGITFLQDGIEVGKVSAGNGFWQLGGFQGKNIWANATIMAPFDQEFNFIINLAVGGNFFPELPNSERPWSNNKTTAMKEFWMNRKQWEPSWNDTEKHGTTSSFLVDSVKVWAL